MILFPQVKPRKLAHNCEIFPNKKLWEAEQQQKLLDQ